VTHLKSKLLAVAFLGVTGCATVQAPPVQFPAIAEPPTQEHHAGKVIFVELVTPDLGDAKRFYGGLFGWTFRDVQGGTRRYATALVDGRPVAGIFERALPETERRRPAWLTYLSTRDVDGATQLAAKEGAKVLFEPHNLPDRGREAVLADPQGAVFALLTSSTGDPPDVLAALGEWIWSSLITFDPAVDATFYKSLFDYEVFDLPADRNVTHLMLASDGYARASANSTPAGATGVHPHWLNYVRVEDAAAMAIKVVALGGKVLVEPRVDRHGGKLAVVADPSGAVFGLLEWTDSQTKEVTQ